MNRPGLEEMLYDAEARVSETFSLQGAAGTRVVPCASNLSFTISRPLLRFVCSAS